MNQLIGTIRAIFVDGSTALPNTQAAEEVREVTPQNGEQPLHGDPVLFKGERVTLSSTQRQTVQSASKRYLSYLGEQHRQECATRPRDQNEPWFRETAEYRGNPPRTNSGEVAPQPRRFIEIYLNSSYDEVMFLRPDITENEQKAALEKVGMKTERFETTFESAEGLIKIPWKVIVNDISPDEVAAEVQKGVAEQKERMTMHLLHLVELDPETTIKHIQRLVGCSWEESLAMMLLLKQHHTFDSRLLNAIKEFDSTVLLIAAVGRSWGGNDKRSIAIFRARTQPWMSLENES